ncbi:MAG: Dyp-type peroxidase domain-containing protein, partial [Acidimicrobiales bacterium]
MTAPRRRIDRRTFLAGAGGAGLGMGVGALVGGSRADSASASTTPTTEPPSLVPFWGDHQAGIATPAQDHLHIAAFDLTTASRDEVAALLATWTATAAALSAGEPAGTVDDALERPPADTGEVLGSGPANLTVTFGFGPGLFEQDGVDRFGLAGRRPQALAELPAFPGDQLDPARSRGDLL